MYRVTFYFFTLWALIYFCELTPFQRYLDEDRPLFLQRNNLQKCANSRGYQGTSLNESFSGREFFFSVRLVRPAADIAGLEFWKLWKFWNDRERERLAPLGIIVIHLGPPLKPLKYCGNIWYRGVQWVTSNGPSL